MNFAFHNVRILTILITIASLLDLVMYCRSTIQCSCGHLNDNLDARIVGGSNTNWHRYPWLTIILKNKKFHCGGSVINNFYILTAGHCVHEGDLQRTVVARETLKIILGVYDRENNQETTRKYYDAADIKAPVIQHTCNMHEIHDIALIKTSAEITFNWAISPICLPPISEFPYIGRSVSVSGWGTMSFKGKLSRFPREAVLKVLKEDDCLQSTDVGYHYSENPVAMFCAYKLGSDACKGDSGGPVAIESGNNTMIQIGIVSWGIQCAMDMHPGVYTKLPHYLYWIFQNTLDAQYCDK